MPSIDILIIVVTLALIWLAALSIYLLKTIGHYKKLTRGENNKSLTQVLEKIVEKQNLSAKQISQLTAELIDIENKDKVHFQKASLIRFNPFEDAGGDQSFVIAILDGKNNGFVISSLHARGGTRVYAKGVLGAKAQSHQFSKEEKEAVEKAARHV